MSDRILVSLCMIVRDAEHDLARCLASAKGSVDEIVVVDTGSRDRSVEVARAHGARVIEIEWPEDFSAARNVSLEAARGEWILVLDSDEALVPPSSDGIRRLARSEEHVGYYLTVRSPVSATDSLDVPVLRLFRNDPSVRFRYPIHEQVVEDLVEWARRDGRRISLVDDLTIAHEGYRPEEVQRRGKAERNRRLFEKAIEQYPQNAYLWYKWADALRSEPDRKGAALEAAERALGLVEAMPADAQRRVPFLPDLLAVCAACRHEEGRAEQALAQLERFPTAQWPSANYAYVAAHVYEAAGRWDEALSSAEEASAVRPSGFSADRPGIRGPLASALRARLHLRRGEWSRAERESRATIEADPGLEAGHRSAADARLAQGDVAGAMQFLTEGLRTARSTTGLCHQLGLLLCRSGRAELAEPLFERAAGQELGARIALAHLRGSVSGELGPEEILDLRALERFRATQDPSALVGRPRARHLAGWLHPRPCMA